MTLSKAIFSIYMMVGLAEKNEKNQKKGADSESVKEAETQLEANTKLAAVTEVELANQTNATSLSDAAQNVNTTSLVEDAPTEESVNATTLVESKARSVNATSLVESKSEAPVPDAGTLHALASGFSVDVGLPDTVTIFDNHVNIQFKIFNLYQVSIYFTCKIVYCVYVVRWERQCSYAPHQTLWTTCMVNIKINKN